MKRKGCGCEKGLQGLQGLEKLSTTKTIVNFLRRLVRRNARPGGHELARLRQVAAVLTARLSLGRRRRNKSKPGRLKPRHGS